MPNVKIRTFYGNPKKYPEWKREVQATMILYGIQQKQLAGLIYLARGAGEGQPRDLLAHLDVATEVCVDDGVDRIFKILDNEFQKEDYVKADDAQAKHEQRPQAQPEGCSGRT